MLHRNAFVDSYRTGFANMLGGSNDGFALGKTVNIPLPIELTSFNATVDKADVLLSWVTASELNNDYFTVLRSGDGFEFELVTIVQGALTSQLEHRYTATDRKPYIGYPITVLNRLT